MVGSKSTALSVPQLAPVAGLAVCSIALPSGLGPADWTLITLTTDTSFSFDCHGTEAKTAV